MLFMVTRWVVCVCVCVCVCVRARMCCVCGHTHSQMLKRARWAKNQEEKDEDMRCWDHRENCSLALTWWKVSPGPWAGPCLCTDAQSQVQESDQGCRHLTTAGDGIQSGQRQDTWAQTAWGQLGPWPALGTVTNNRGWSLGASLHHRCTPGTGSTAPVVPSENWGNKHHQLLWAEWWSPNSYVDILTTICPSACDCIGIASLKKWLS